MNKTDKLNLCFLCGKPLTDTQSSSEHVIPNALGGRMHSKKLVCEDCNSFLGRTIDPPLVDALSVPASLLDVSRQRGRNRTLLTDDNDDYNLAPGIKPVLKQPLVNEKSDENGAKTIHIEADTEEDMRKAIQALKVKYPSIDVEKEMKNFQKRMKQIEGSVHIDASIDGEKIFPSIIKTAVEFYLMKRGHVKYVSHLIPVIKGKVKAADIEFFYPDEPVFSLPDEDDKIFHVLHITGDPKEKILYAYVSFFDILQCLMILNDEYNGKPMNISYVYNVLTTKNFSSDPNYKFTRDSLHSAMKTAGTNITRLGKHYRSFLAKAERRANIDVWTKQTKEVTDEVMRRYASEPFITNEMIEAVAEEFVKRIMPR